MGHSHYFQAMDKGHSPVVHTVFFTPEIYTILITEPQMVLNSRRMNLLVAHKQVRTE